MDLWALWDFKGDLGLGVIDQRSDDIETIDVIAKRLEPALKHFPRERVILISQCGFGHVPLDITQRKLAALVEASQCVVTGASRRRRQEGAFARRVNRYFAMAAATSMFVGRQDPPRMSWVGNAIRCAGRSARPSSRSKRSCAAVRPISSTARSISVICPG